MSNERISEDIKELEYTYKIFNLKISICIIFSFTFFLTSKTPFFTIGDPTPVLLWFTGLYGIVLAVIPYLSSQRSKKNKKLIECPYQAVHQAFMNWYA